MSDFSIVNGVYDKLTNDATFLSYLGLNPSSSAVDKHKKIQLEMVPNGLAVDNIPLACIYPIAGLRERINNLIYDAMFEVTIYSNSSWYPLTGTTKAGTMLIGQRARELLHQVDLGGATFLTEFQTSFSGDSEVPGIKKYVMRFKVSEVIE